MVKSKLYKPAIFTLLLQKYLEVLCSRLQTWVDWFTCEYCFGRGTSPAIVRGQIAIIRQPRPRSRPPASAKRRAGGGDFSSRASARIVLAGGLVLPQLQGRLPLLGTPRKTWVYWFSCEHCFGRETSPAMVRGWIAIIRQPLPINCPHVKEIEPTTTNSKN